MWCHMSHKWSHKYTKEQILSSLAILVHTNLGVLSNTFIKHSFLAAADKVLYGIITKTKIAVTKVKTHNESKRLINNHISII